MLGIYIAGMLCASGIRTSMEENDKCPTWMHCLLILCSWFTVGLFIGEICNNTKKDKT